ncbi:MAG: T9SS type A sorting domain-containing protein [Bacteroidetes bacterium]|nr:T9SS type A sorting domain-containing protein [Bacteroidota bacterium]
MSDTAHSGNIVVQGLNECGGGFGSEKSLLVKNCIGIGQHSLSSAIRIFPNPVSGELTIGITGKEKELELTISDLNGIVHYSEKLLVNSADFRKKISMSGFTRGVYLLKLSSNDRLYREKVIVQ